MRLSPTARTFLSIYERGIAKRDLSVIETTKSGAHEPRHFLLLSEALKERMRAPMCRYAISFHRVKFRTLLLDGLALEGSSVASWGNFKLHMPAGQTAR